jgi:hypothetical protein
MQKHSPSQTPSPFDVLIEKRRAATHSSTPAPETFIPATDASGPPKLEFQQPATRPAKRDDPEYQKFTVYVPKKTHRAAKALASIQSRELSDIVAELLRDWLRNHSNTVSDAVDDV